jgi:hypothetical protein
LPCINDDLQTWIPLATEYDAASSTVSAVAPHFSWYSVDVVDYAKALAIMAIGNVLPVWVGVALRSRELRNTIIDSLRESLKLDQLHDSCGTKKDPDYEVAFDLGDLSGCVVTDPTKELQVENHSAVPFDIALPPGGTAAGINLDSLRDEDLPDLLAHLVQWGLGQEYVGGKSATSLDLSNDLATTPFWSSPAVTPDLLGVAMSAVLGALSIVPEEKEFLTAVKDRTFLLHLKQFADGHGQGFDVTALIREIEFEFENVGATGTLKFARIADEGLTCIQDWWKAVAKDGIGEKLLADALNNGVKCASLALGHVRDSAKKGYDETIGIMNGIGDLGGSIHQIIDFAALGPESLHTGMTVTYSPPMTAAQAAAVVADATPGECGALPSGVPLVQGAPAAATCYFGVQADLDGNGRPDSLIIWVARTGSTDETTNEGATAFLDDGSVHVLAEPFSSWGLTSPVRQYDQATDVVSLRDDSTQQVHFAASLPGANTSFTVVFALDTGDRSLHVLAGDQGATFVYPIGGGVNYPSRFGCIRGPDGHQAIALFKRFPVAPSDPSSQAVLWAVEYYQVVGTSLRYVGRHGGYAVTAQAADSLPDAGTGCSVPGQAALPTLSRIDPEAPDPVTAASALVQAASVPGFGLDYASSEIGASITATTPAGRPDGGRIWDTVLARIGPAPTAWGGIPAICAAPAKSGPEASSPTRAACQILPADGSRPLSLTTEQTAHGWVVVSVQ